MKTKKYLWMLMMVLAVFAVSCEKDEDPTETCDSEDLAEDYNCPIDVDAIATFCADGVSDSYYTYNGEDYSCTGVDVSTCDGAIDQISDALIEAGCGDKKKSGSMESGKIKLSQMAENLLAEVRLGSLYE
jgi:hypothetical protein